METEIDRCRLCWSEDVIKESIFDRKDENGVDVGTKIILCTSLMVTYEDMYPKYICNQCTYLVDLFFDFRNTCLKTHINMHNTIQAVSEQNTETFLIQVAEPEKDIKYVDENHSPTQFLRIKSLLPNDKSDGFDKDIAGMVDDEEEEEDGDAYEEEEEGEGDEDEEELQLPPNGQQQLEKIKRVYINDLGHVENEEVILCDDNAEELYFDRQFQVGCYVAINGETENMNEKHDGSNLLRRYKCMKCKKVFATIVELDGHWDCCGKLEDNVDVTEYQIDGFMESQQSDQIFYDEEGCDPFETVPEGEEEEGKETRKFKKKQNDKEFCCETCGKVFKQLLLLKRHIQVKHIRIRPFSCPNCPRSFYDKYELKYHQRLHEDVEDFCCSVCGRRFARRSGLKAHMRSHTGEKPFRCKLCTKNFAHVNSLIAHERVHTGERPYTCSYCDRTFAQYSTAKSHEDMHMGGERMYQCNVCDRMYRTELELESHSVTHAVQAMTHKCVVCNRGFKKRAELNKHNQRYHCASKPFPCVQCSKSYVTLRELNLHMTVHTGEQPFTCMFCGKCYRLKATLRRHMFKHHHLDIEALDHAPLR